MVRDGWRGMVHEVSIELAKVQIYDNVALQSQAPESLKLAAGTPLLLRFVCAYVFCRTLRTCNVWLKLSLF